jgi:hypothetical protein
MKPATTALAVAVFTVGLSVTLSDQANYLVTSAVAQGGGGDPGGIARGAIVSSETPASSSQQWCLWRHYGEGLEAECRYELERSQRQLQRGGYRELEPALYHDRYGHPLHHGYSYVETDDGTRLLIEVTTGAIAEILEMGEEPSDSPQTPRESEVRPGDDIQEGGIDPTRGRADVVPRNNQGRIPPGHRPPPGRCRVWFPDRPPGQQPPAGPCDVQVPSGAFLIRG